jgi:RNA polymerase I-specific transcription initiation factor RRN6
MGNSAVSELLEENMNRYSRVEGEISDRPLLSIGQMTNVSDHWRVAGSPMLAAATGESGELLRLARVDQSKWQWGTDKHTTLQPSVIDPDDPEEEAIWASDGLPISQVKFATSMSRYDAIRWLIVQKQTSTTVLNPEYHKIPVAQSSTADLNIQHPRLSRIDPNPILTISHKMTGGNAQMDVAFNPNSKGQSPQIAIIDECGYWSIWNTLGGRPKTRLSPYKFGHISDGLLNDIPSTTEHKAEKHGIQFVGAAEVDSFWEDESQNADESGESAKRSSHLLIWNREKYEVIDLESHIALPQLSLLARPKSKPDAILDIRVSPANQNHIFVLTMRTLYWIDLFATRKEENSSSTKPTILISCPRLLDREALRMTTCLTSEGGQQAVMVFVFSPTHRQLQTYWFGHSKQSGLPYWHRDVLSLPSDSNAIKGDIQSLEIHPAKLTQDGKPSSGLGADYYRTGVQFFQGSILSKDLGVQYCICVSVKDRRMQIALPTGRLVRSKTDQAQRWKKKRKQFLRHMGNAFVLPDGMADNINDVVKRHSRSTQMDIMKNRTSAVFGPIHLKLDLMCRYLRQTLVAISGSIHDVPPTLLYAIQENIAEGTAEGRLPLKTWKEIGDQTGPMNLASYNNTEQPDILDLFLGDDGQTVVTQLGRQTSEEWIRELVSLSHLNQTYVDLWLDPVEGRLPEEEEEIRKGWIADLAKDMFLATAGVMVQDTPLLGTASQGGDERTQPTQSSAIRTMPSQTSNGDIPSSPSSTTSNTTSDAAIRRLQLLAPSLRMDKMETAKQSSVLSRWPTERGVSTDDYISSVAIASDRKFEDARLRLQRMENKRKAHAEKYRLPPTMRQGGESTPKARKLQNRTGGLGAPPRSSQMRPHREDPAELPPMPAAPMPAQFMSSQQGMPSSSQSQGFFGPSIAMSQPVPGNFGDRKKAKKPKRKSGFR